MTSSDSSVYFLIALPSGDNAAKNIGDLHNILKARGADYEHLSHVPIERLRVGTLDKLISLSDDFARIDAFGKNVVQKLHRTHSDFEQSDTLLSVKNQSIHNYIFNFVWDEGHFNPHAQLRDLVQSIHSNMLKTAEHLRKKTANLSELQNALQNIVRKKTGSLMTKSLVEYVKRETWYQGEYLRSALVVIPTTKVDEFLEQYEFMEDSDANVKYEAMLNKQKADKQAEKQAQVERLRKARQSNTNAEANDDAEPEAEAEEKVEQPGKEQEQEQEQEDDKFNVSKIREQCRIVVPDSAVLVTSDQEYSLYRVMLLKRGYTWFKYVCLQQGYNVRDFDICQLDAADDEKEVENLTKSQVQQSKKLRMFCMSNFAQIFENWIHLKIIRVFVEGVLRFGLPVNFFITVVKPRKGSEKRLLQTLENEYKGLLDKALQGKQENEIDYSGLSTDFYPFVYVPLSFSCS